MDRLMMCGWSYATRFVKASWSDVDMLPFTGKSGDGRVDPEIVIGWSLGGLIAMQMILDGQLQPSGLVLISSTSCFCADEGYPHGVSRKALRSMMAGLRRDRVSTLTSFYRDAASPDQLDDASLQARLEQAGFFSDAELLDGLRRLETIDVRTRLGSLAIPVLILHGSLDRIIPVKAAEFMAGQLDRSELHIHADAGHEMILRQAEWLTHRIDQFAAGL